MALMSQAITQLLQEEWVTCFQCYRAELERERSLGRAGELDTASVERFQSVLPFEPVNRARLHTLKAERAVSRTAMTDGVGRFVDRRRHAQIAARHALQRVASGFPARAVARSPSQDGDRAWASAVHAAELQLPESWLPFVVMPTKSHPTHAILSTRRSAGCADAPEMRGSAGSASLRRS